MRLRYFRLKAAIVGLAVLTSMVTVVKLATAITPTESGVVEQNADAQFNTATDFDPPPAWHVQALDRPQGQGVAPINVIFSAKSNVQPRPGLAYDKPSRHLPLDWVGYGSCQKLAATVNPRQSVPSEPQWQAHKLYSHDLDPICLSADALMLASWDQDSGAEFLSVREGQDTGCPGFKNSVSWCILSNGFNDARDKYVKDYQYWIPRLEPGWTVNVKYLQLYPSGTGEDGVPYDGRVAVITVHKP